MHSRPTQWLITTVRVTLLVLVVTLCVGCGGDEAIEDSGPAAEADAAAQPSPNGGAAAALVMGSWDAVLHNCMIDTQTGVLGPCQTRVVGDRAALVPPRAAVVPGGRLAIIALDDLVEVRRIDGGQIGDPGTEPARLPGPASGIVLHPTRRLAYVSTADEVLAFSFSREGALAAVPGSPFPIVARSLVFRPDGAFVYAAGPRTDAHRLAAYHVEQSGALTWVRTYSSGPGPADIPSDRDIVIDRTGAHLIARDCAVYRIDQGTGLLTLAFSDPTEAVTLAPHPQQDLIFRVRATGGSSRRLETLRLDVHSGALSVVSTVEMRPPHHGGYTLLAVEPLGRSLYHVTTEGINELMAVYRYAIQSDGTLSPPGGSLAFSLADYPAVFVPFRGPG